MNNNFTYLSAILTILGFVALIIGSENIAIVMIAIGVFMMIVQTIRIYFFE